MAEKQSYSLTRFGDVAREVREAERDPLENGLDRLIGLEHIEPENLHIKEWGSVADGTSFTRVFRKGQVLFGKRRAYQRKVALAEFDGICSSDIVVMEAIEDKLVPELLPFIVQSEGFFEYALSTSAGSLSPRTKWKHLAEYQILPTPQRRAAPHC
jgi:type I restriction enzyme, S subunit